MCFPHAGPGRFYGPDPFTPAAGFGDSKRGWQIARSFQGGRWRRVRYKEGTKVLWRGGAQRKELRLFGLAPTADRKTKTGRKYHRQKAYWLTDDLTNPATVLRQAYFDRFEIEFNPRDEQSVIGVGQAQVWAKQSGPRVPEFLVAADRAWWLEDCGPTGPSGPTPTGPYPSGGAGRGGRRVRIW